MWSSMMPAPNLPLSPTSSSSTDIPSDLSSSSHLNRQTILLDTTVPLADLGSSCTDLPSTPKTPDSGVGTNAIPFVNGTFTHRVHSKPGHNKKDTNRRKEQNRNAQRAFRERKEKRLQDLQGRIEKLAAKQQPLAEENRYLKQLVSQLQEDNRILNASKTAFECIAFQKFSSTASPLQAEMQSQISSTSSARNASTKSTSSSRFSSPRKTVAGDHDPGTGLQISIASQSSTQFPFLHLTPPGVSQQLTSNDYADTASILGLMNSEAYSSNIINQLLNRNNLEHRQLQPENSYIFGTPSVPTSALSSSAPHKLQSWYNLSTFSPPE